MAFAKKNFTIPPELIEVERLKRQIADLARDHQQSVQRDEEAHRDGPSEESSRALRAVRAAYETYHAELERAQRALGIPEALLLALEQAQVPHLEDRFGRREVDEVAPTASLDDLTPPALERMLRLVDPTWLRAEAAKGVRLGDEFLRRPLHLVNGVRLRSADLHAPRPQRFAMMLSVCLDHLAKEKSLDFFEEASAVPEIAMLGNALGDVERLGPEATAKLAALPAADDAKVASIFHELLVGAAFVRRGRDVRMLAENRRTKTPDFELLGLGVPMAIECKRRMGISDYELAEARHVERLYGRIRPMLVEAGLHLAIDVRFFGAVGAVTENTFEHDVRRLLERVDTTARVTVDVDWGSIGCEVLPYTFEFPPTRLYSAEFLETVFGWRQLQTDWDGLLCEVDPPDSVVIRRARNPRCVKWASESDEAMVKKARGLTSMWGRAASQFRAGEMGLVYLAYPEGGRTVIADARTSQIQQESRMWSARWSVRVPLTIVGRLYPRALGAGLPDLIESSFGVTIDGDEMWLGMFPSNVFTLKAQS